MSEDQTPEEIAAHVGSDGPVTPVVLFLHSVLIDRNLSAVWELLTDGLRRRLVEAWVAANVADPWLQQFDVHRLADNLLSDKAPALAWRGFEVTQVDEIAEAYVGVDTWGVATRPRTIGPGLEVVLLVNPEDVPDSQVFHSETVVRAHSFLVEHDPAHGWRIHNFAADIPDAR